MFFVTQPYFLSISSPEQPVHSTSRAAEVHLKMLTIATMSLWIVILELMINFLDGVSAIWNYVGNLQGLTISLKLCLTPGTKPNEMSHSTSTFQ